MTTLRKRDILIRSQDATTGVPNNFTINLPGGIVNNVVKSNLRSFSIDGVALNVDFTNSGFVLIYYGGILTTVTVNMLPGTYNDSTLCIMLQGVLNQAWATMGGTGTFSATVNNLGYLIIINSVSDEWSLAFVDGAVSYALTAQLLGLPAGGAFPEPKIPDVPPYYSYGTSPLSLLNIPFLMVQCSQLSNRINTSGQLYAWAIVPFNASFNTNILIYDNQCPADFTVQHTPLTVSTLDIRILDQYGNLVALSNSDVYLQIEIYYLSN
jgi:hypothetical protein